MWWYEGEGKKRDGDMKGRERCGGMKGKGRGRCGGMKGKGRGRCGGINER